MPSLLKMSPPAEVVHLQGSGNLTSANSPDTRFYFEDGWVFREHHGKHVECIGRVETTQPALSKFGIVRNGGAK